MAVSSYSERLRDLQQRKSTLLCVGIDPDPERLPAHLRPQAGGTGRSAGEAVVHFSRAVIEATAPFAAAFKLNLAFFEALGADGWRALQDTLDALPEDVLAIADGKRGDIGNSARFYARSTFETLGFDACTVSGYMGRDSVEPFLEYAGCGTYLLARTSNPGGADFQELQCGNAPLYERVVRAAQTWSVSTPGRLGFVAGATDAGALRRIRSVAPEAPLLIPGIGAQGGDVRAVMEAAAAGSGPILVNSSRSIIYASLDRDFAAAAGRAARELRDVLADHGG